jgi:Cu/Ag efflux protein CusF
VSLQPRYLFLLGLVVLSAATALTPRDAAAQGTDTGEGGLFSGQTATHTAAAVVKTDPATNTVTLRDDNGAVTDVVVDRAVGDVKKLRIGDRVDITYKRALVLSAEKTGSGSIRERVDTQTITPASGGSTTSTHRVQAVATVLAIDRANRKLTLRGPTGTMTLQATDDRFLKGLNVGDNIRVDYLEATALQVMRDGIPVQ